MSKKYVGPDSLKAFLNELKNTVDTELSSTSTNPVQNKVINAELEEIANAFDVYDEILETKADASDILEPLIGTTAEITPTQVEEAIVSGRPVAISHTDEAYGTCIFNYFAKANPFDVIISSGIVYYYGEYIVMELLGDTTGNYWQLLSSIVAQKDQLPTALKNPNALTINGVSYDGSSAVNATDTINGMIDDKIVEPLIGTTAEITPTQVAEAVAQGRDVVIEYTHETYGVERFANFIIFESLGSVNASGVFYHDNQIYAIELVGRLSANQWYPVINILASEADIPTVPTSLKNPNALTFTGAVTGSYDGSSAKTVNIPTVPTKTSELTNDSGFITEADIPTVDIPVTSVNGQTGDVTIDIPTVPTSLKNPNALTFTGAVTGSYDGSSAKTVNIPTVPTSLKNPNALTFTGAVTGSYDGSSAKTVNIPTVPTSLKNPNALTINDTSYDGSSAVTISTAHNHDSAYDIKGSADSALASAKIYADSAAATVKNDLLNGAGTAYDTLKELGDLIDDNVDAIVALEAVAAGKADKSHTHAATDITSGTLSSDRLPTVPITKGGTGATTAAAALTNLGLTATAAEINKLDGLTATTTELNYVDGVTSNIQTQLNNKMSLSDNNVLADGKTLKLSMYNNRYLTISGNSISADMSNCTGGWAGSFASVKHNDPDSTAADGTTTTTMLGWYGGATDLTHIFMGGTYSDPAMKMTPEGQFTFKNAPKVGSDTVALQSALTSGLAGKADTSHTHGNITSTGAIGTTANKAVITTTNGVLTTGTVPIASGGTGATTAAGALTNLGLTATAAELNIMDGVTATAAEINKLDGLTATTTELNYVDGVTSNIQTQLNAKAASGHTHNYAGSSSAGGSATSANKVVNALTFTGAVTGSYDGSAAKTVNIPTVPTSLKNPKALTINGTSYDGSTAVSVTTPKAFYITATVTNGKCTFDKTFQEIKAAHESGNTLIAIYDGNYYSLKGYAVEQVDGAPTGAVEINIVFEYSTMTYKDEYYDSYVVNTLTMNGTAYNGNEQINIYHEASTWSLLNHRYDGIVQGYLDNKTNIGHTHTVSHTPAGTVSKPTFSGTKATISSDYTPAGTVSKPTFTGSAATSGKPSATSTVASSTHTHKYTPAGTVSKPTFTGSATTSGGPSATTTVNSITAVGTLPSLTASVANRCLTLTFSAGTLPTKGADTSVATGGHTHSVTATGTVSQPTFTGTEASTTSISGTTTVAGNEHTHSVTATGTVSQPTFSGTKATISAEYTPAGSVSQPTFTGTAATITSSADV